MPPTPTSASEFFYEDIPETNNVTISGFKGGATGDLVIPANSDTGKLITAIKNNPNPPIGAVTSLNFELTSITSIGESSFKNKTGLTSLTLPSTLETIGFEAFKGCTTLAAVSLPASITTIGENVFKECAALLSVTINKTNGNITVGNSAFQIKPGPPSEGDPTMNIYVDSATLDINNSKTYLTDTSPTSIFPPLSKRSFQALCFLEGTLILTPSGYKAVETLKEGDLVRTLNGDKPIDSIFSQTVNHDASAERNMHQLFSLNYPAVFQPLIVTGGHSTLITPTPTQLELVKSMFPTIGPIDGFYRLPAFVDEKASVYEVSGDYRVYHLFIGKTFEGIFANGLLVESCVIL